MKVGQTRHPRFRQLITWRVPTKFQDSVYSDPIVPDPYPRDWEPPEFFALNDFPEPDGDWTEIDTWPFGGLGLFVEEVEPLPEVVPDFHRTGLEFENELYDMTEAALPMLTVFFGGATWHTEVPYGWQAGQGEQGRTDIVVCEFDWEAYRERREVIGTSSLADQNWGYFNSYRHIARYGPYTKQGFITNGPYSDSYAYKIWNWLERHGYLAYNSGFGGHATAMPLPDHVEAAHAIELKQSTWREALEQAERANGPDDPDALDETDPGYARRYDPGNAGYADYRWVALDAGHMKAAMENRDAFREAGIGLLAVAEGGVVQVVEADRCEHPEQSVDRLKLREDSIAQLTPERVEKKAEEEPEPEGDDTEATEGAAQTALGRF